MSYFPSRCQHIKVNGTQCGSPALRRNRFCFFHKRFRDEQIKLAADRKRQTKASFVLPVLEDANSIQVALMQVMRLLVSQQIEHKTASLLLYALQTASSNLRKADFNPYRHDVILDPRDAADSTFDLHLWDDDDFLTEEEEQENEIERQADIEAEEARKQARKRLEAERKRKADEAYMYDFVKKNPHYGLKRVNGVLKFIYPSNRKPDPVVPAAVASPASPVATAAPSFSPKQSSPAKPPEPKPQAQTPVAASQAKQAASATSKPTAQTSKPPIEASKPKVQGVGLGIDSPEMKRLAQKLSGNHTVGEFEDEIDRMARKYFLNDVPESILPKDWRQKWGYKKPAESVKKEKESLSEKKSV